MTEYSDEYEFLISNNILWSRYDQDMNSDVIDINRFI
jgi:hypothetical protein